LNAPHPTTVGLFIEALWVSFEEEVCLNKDMDSGEFAVSANNMAMFAIQ
jgi:hypothetical protein